MFWTIKNRHFCTIKIQSMFSSYNFPLQLFLNLFYHRKNSSSSLEMVSIWNKQSRKNSTKCRIYFCGHFYCKVSNSREQRQTIMIIDVLGGALFTKTSWKLNNEVKFVVLATMMMKKNQNETQENFSDDTKFFLNNQTTNKQQWSLLYYVYSIEDICFCYFINHLIIFPAFVCPQ